MVYGAKEGCAAIRAGTKNQKNEKWNDEVSPRAERKETAWEDALGTEDDIVKERCMGVCKDKESKVKRCKYKKKRR